MVKIRLKNILLIVSFLLMDIFYVYGDEEINLHHIGNQNDRIEHFIPFDLPDVYYDNANQAIIIDGDGAVDYYDVEIAPVTSSFPVITTQVNGYYDTINISTLPQGVYVITIYSPEDNTYEGFFEIE